MSRGVRPSAIVARTVSARTVASERRVEKSQIAQLSPLMLDSVCEVTSTESSSIARARTCWIRTRSGDER